MSVILLSHGEIGSGAMRAHLLGLARRLSAHETVHHLALAGPRLLLGAAGRDLLAEHRAEAAALVSGRVLVRPHGPRGLGGPIVTRLVAQAVRSLVGRGPAVLHARGYQAALVACEARDLEGARWKVLHDVRGDRSAEVASHGGELPADRVEELEREAFRRSDAHAVVSGLLAEVVHARGASGEAEVFPCAADTERFRPDPQARRSRRDQVGASDESFVLGFVGSVAGWQRPDALLRLFQLVAERESDPHLLVLTPAVDAFRELLIRELPEGARWSVRFAPHDEVPSWLNACDATALLRDRDAVNRVASPIKFGESLACGVPVLLTRGIGDASSLVASGGLGALFSGPELAEPGDLAVLDGFLMESRERGEDMAERCRRAARELWSWDEQVLRWLALHRRLAASASVGH